MKRYLIVNEEYWDHKSCKVHYSEQGVILLQTPKRLSEIQI